MPQPLHLRGKIDAEERIHDHVERDRPHLDHHVERLSAAPARQTAVGMRDHALDVIGGRAAGERGIGEGAHVVMDGAVFDQHAMPQKLGDGVALCAPKQPVFGRHQDEAVGLRPNQDDRVEARQRQPEDIAQPAVKGL